MKVEQFKVKNQFIIRDEDKVFFQSYNSTIAKIERIGLSREITLGADWNYSTTTSKYLYMFLEEEAGLYEIYNKSNKRAYIEKLIKEGVIKYDNNL